LLENVPDHLIENCKRALRVIHIAVQARLKYKNTRVYRMKILNDIRRIQRANPVNTTLTEEHDTSCIEIEKEK
jgi:hypothetical protein